MHDHEILSSVTQGAGRELNASSDPEGRIAAAVRRLDRAGHAAHPSLSVPLDRLAAHVGSLLPAGGDDAAAVAGQIDTMHAADLYLATACAIGAPGAASVFEREQLSRLPAYLSRLRPTPEFLDEIRQSLAIKLLVAGPGQKPRITEYSARGPLGGWLRVVALRAALDVHRKPVDQALPTDSRGGAVAGVIDPEIDYLKRRHGADFRAALREALAGLPEEQRELLRMNFVEGLNIEAIGARKNVHRATVARWIAAARAAILEDTHRRLQERLGLRESEIASLVGALHSELEMSVAGLMPPTSARD